VGQVLEWVAAQEAEGRRVAAAELLHRLTGETGGEVSARFLIDPGAPAPGERQKADLLKRLRQQALEMELEGLGYGIRALEGEAERQGPEGLARLTGLLERKQSLARELAKLREPAPPGSGWEEPAG